MSKTDDMEYLPIRMIRRDLADLPQHTLPEGYSLRAFAPGDRETWLRLWRAAETFQTIHDEMFDNDFADDLPGMARRCLFLVSPAGEDIGTATAWYERRYLGRAWGRVHWVCIVPAEQGKGLSRGLMTATMNLLRALGHRRAVLATQTPRIAAIRTYLHFGFVPDLADPGATHAWRLVARHIDHPALKALV